MRSLRAVSFKATDGSGVINVDAKKLSRMHSRALLDT